MLKSISLENPIFPSLYSQGGRVRIKISSHGSIPTGIPAILIVAFFKVLRNHLP